MTLETAAEYLELAKNTKSRGERAGFLMAARDEINEALKSTLKQMHDILPGQMSIDDVVDPGRCEYVSSEPGDPPGMRCTLRAGHGAPHHFNPPASCNVQDTRDPEGDDYTGALCSFAPGHQGRHSWEPIPEHVVGADGLVFTPGDIVEAEFKEDVSPAPGRDASPVDDEHRCMVVVMDDRCVRTRDHSGDHLFGDPFGDRDSTDRVPFSDAAGLPPMSDVEALERATAAGNDAED